MNPIRQASRWLLFVVVLLGTSLAFGQGGTATVIGSVYDPTGAVIPGAQVQLINQATGVPRVTTSDGRGFFSFVGVVPGTYDLAASARGFQPLKRQGISVHINDQLDLTDLVLKVGGTSQTVEVTEAAQEVTPTTSGEKSYTITAKQVENLSIIGRNTIELFKIIPGANNTGGWNGQYSGEVASFNTGVGAHTVNGVRFDAVAVVSDGGATIDTGANSGSAVTPNVEFVQEAKVETSSFSAENPFGPVVMANQTKSGSKDFHGSAYYSLRDSALNANDWQNNANGVAKPGSRFQYPGFTIGGPVLIPGTNFNKKRDKLFFFGGFEWQRQDVDLGLKRAVVPTDAMRAGDFSDTAYLSSLTGSFVKAPVCQGATLPAYCSSVGHIGAIDPGGAILMGLYPHANANPATTGGFNYVEDLVNPQPRAQQLVKLDYHISNNNVFSARYNHEAETLPYPYGLWQSWPNVQYPGGVLGNNWAHSVATNLTSAPTSTLTNQLAFSITYLNYNNTLSKPQAVSASALHYPYAGYYNNGLDLVPNIDATAGSGIDSIDNRGGMVPSLRAPKWTTTVYDTVSKMVGTHLFKVGLYVDRVTSYQATTALDQGAITLADWGTYTGNGYADLLTGHIAMWTQSTKNVIADMASNRFDGFVQDTWKIGRRVTLNYGTRVGHIGWWYDRNGNIAVLDPSKYDPNAPLSAYSGLFTHARNSSTPDSGFKPTGVQFSPQVGLAWDPTGSGNTVIRGGFGMNYFREEAVNSANLVQNPPLLATGYFAPSGLTLATVGNSTTAPTNYLNVAAMNDDELPRTYSYNLTVARKLPFATNLEAAYVGNRSTHLVGWPNINAVPEGAESNIGWPGTWDDPTYRPYATYGAGIWATSHVLKSSYDSLQVTANRQTGRINYWISYAFSKALGTNNADAFDLNRYYGPLPFDRTQSLKLAYNINLPDVSKNHLGNHAMLNGMLDGWQVSGVTEFTSGAPTVFVADFPGASYIKMQGVNNVAWGQLGSRFIVGTPDENSVPLVICDPTANLGPHQIFNASCFQAPTRGHNGTYRPPYMHGPWYNNSDLSLFKNFKMAESRNLQVRAEMFNFLNHPLWTFINNDPALNLYYSNYGATPDNTSTAGVMTNKTGHRIVQIAIKFTF